MSPRKFSLLLCSPVLAQHARVPSYSLEDGVSGRLWVVAVEKEVLVHTYNPATLPEVLVEEEQVLGLPLREQGGTSDSVKAPWGQGGHRVAGTRVLCCLL